MSNSSSAEKKEIFNVAKVNNYVKWLRKYCHHRQCKDATSGNEWECPWGCLGPELKTKKVHCADLLNTKTAMAWRLADKLRELGKQLYDFNWNFESRTLDKEYYLDSARDILESLAVANEVARYMYFSLGEHDSDDRLYDKVGIIKNTITLMYKKAWRLRRDCVIEYEREVEDRYKADMEQAVVNVKNRVRRALNQEG